MAGRGTIGLMLLATGGCATAAGDDGYVLVTNEPFRSMAVRGDAAVVRAVEIGEDARTYRVTERREGAGGVIDWRAEADGSRIVFSIRPGPCEDDMSAQRYPLIATIGIDGAAAAGCARRATDPVPPIPGE